MVYIRPNWQKGEDMELTGDRAEKYVEQKRRADQKSGFEGLERQLKVTPSKQQQVELRSFEEVRKVQSRRASQDVWEARKQSVIDWNAMLPEEQQQELRAIFEEIDIDGSGEIDFDELTALIRTLGQDASPAQVQGMMDEADTDGSGTIGWDEFLQVIVNAKLKAATDTDGRLTQNRTGKLCEDVQHRITMSKISMMQSLEEIIVVEVGYRAARPLLSSSAKDFFSRELKKGCDSVLQQLRKVLETLQDEVGSIFRGEDNRRQVGISTIRAQSTGFRKSHAHTHATQLFI